MKRVDMSIAEDSGHKDLATYRSKSGRALDVQMQRFGAGGYGGRYSQERHIPSPYPFGKFIWGVKKDIARIPSVIARDLISGPERTISPQIAVDSDSQNRSNAEWRSSGEVQIAPTRKAREDALRNLPYMYQKYLKDFPVLCAVRQRVNRLLGGR